MGGKLFLYSAKTPAGLEVVDRVEATDLEDARRTLEARGDLHDIRYHGDSTIPEMQAMAAGGEPPAPVVSPHDELQSGFTFSRGPSAQYLVRALSLPVAVVAILWTIQFARGMQYDIGFVFICLVTLPCAGFAAVAVLPPILYPAVIERSAWNDHRAVLWLAGLLRVALKPFDVKIVHDDLDFRRARALAGLGRKDEAFALAESIAQRGTLPRWIWHARMASVYAALRDIDAQVECESQSVKLGPGESGPIIQLAIAVLAGKHHATEGRRLLELARPMAVVEMGKPHLNYAEGLLALLEDRPADARAFFAEGRRAGAPYASNPLAAGLGRIIQGWEAVAAARCGDAEGARNLFREVRSYAVRIDERELLAEARKHVPGT